MLPYTEKITRKEFLLVMYDLLARTQNSDSTVLDSFYDAGVLIGYNTGLELDKKLLYSEMYSFLYRFEIYDFENSTVKTALTDLPQYINKAIAGTITKMEFISFLDEVYENTGRQVDLIDRIETDLGKNWTLREAGDYLDEIYSKEGFKYTDGETTVSISKAK